MATGPQTFLDGLQQLASDAMRLATLPDADPAFCMKIAQAAVAKARPQPTQKPGGPPAQGGAPPGGGAPGMGIGPQGMPGGAPGGSPANGQQPTLGAPTMGGPPVPPGSQGLSPGNPDEIRRMIAGAGQG